MFWQHWTDELTPSELPEVHMHFIALHELPHTDQPPSAGPHY